MNRRPKSLVPSRLLRGERGLSASHIRNTAKALHIAPELLI
jgi:antitoxin component HigA of HigAB toxin-antitoxin module